MAILSITPDFDKTMKVLHTLKKDYPEMVEKFDRFNPLDALKEGPVEFTLEDTTYTVELSNDELPEPSVRCRVTEKAEKANTTKNKYVDHVLGAIHLLTGVDRVFVNDSIFSVHVSVVPERLTWTITKTAIFAIGAAAVTTIAVGAIQAMLNRD